MRNLKNANGSLEILKLGRTNCKVSRESADEMTTKNDDYGIKTRKKSKPNSDHFLFVSKTDEKTTTTNRQILSEVNGIIR